MSLDPSLSCKIMSFGLGILLILVESCNICGSVLSSLVGQYFNPQYVYSVYIYIIHVPTILLYAYGNQ